MRKIIVGRGNDCDIVIPDERDNVSRHHLVISFNLLGKMTISDTSSNGTFINEKKMLKGTSIPVTRNDKIRLGDRWDLDWSLVKDPYVTVRKYLITVVVVVVVAVVAVVWYAWGRSETDKKQEPVVEPKEYSGQNSGEWNKDSTNRVAPTETSIMVGDKAATQVEPEKPKSSKTRSKATRHRRTEKRTRTTTDVDVRSDNMPVIN